MSVCYGFAFFISFILCVDVNRRKKGKKHNLSNKLMKNYTGQPILSRKTLLFLFVKLKCIILQSLNRTTVDKLIKVLAPNMICSPVFHSRLPCAISPQCSFGPGEMLSSELSLSAFGQTDQIDSHP